MPDAGHSSSTAAATSQSREVQASTQLRARLEATEKELRATADELAEVEERLRAIEGKREAQKSKLPSPRLSEQKEVQEAESRLSEAGCLQAIHRIDFAQPDGAVKSAASKPSRRLALSARTPKCWAPTRRVESVSPRRRAQIPVSRPKSPPLSSVAYRHVSEAPDAGRSGTGARPGSVQRAWRQPSACPAAARTQASGACVRRTSPLSLKETAAAPSAGPSTTTAPPSRVVAHEKAAKNIDKAQVCLRGIPLAVPRTLATNALPRRRSAPAKFGVDAKDREALWRHRLAWADQKLSRREATPGQESSTSIDDSIGQETCDSEGAEAALLSMRMRAEESHLHVYR